MISRNAIEVTLLISNNTGVLSSLMLKGGSLGLVYLRQNTEKLNDDQSRMTLFFNGDFNCSKQESISSFEELSDVLKVEKIDVEGPKTIKPIQQI